MGIVANPASARDIRRIVAHGGAVTTHDKLNRLQRVLAGLAAAGVDRVISMSDRGGIMSGLMQLAGRPSADGWPTLDFVDQPITQSDADTVLATRTMVEAGVGAIVVLGGDGTNRVVAGESETVPLVSISTGTNNAFPRPAEPTVAGLAAGLVANDDRCRTAGTYRAESLLVEWGARVERALVDVAISDSDGVGSGAVWDATSLSELFLCFAEADAIGLSAIGGHLPPIGRREPGGLAVGIGEPTVTKIRPPIGPGLLTPVGIRSISVLEPDSPTQVQAPSGVVALDGERLFRFGPTARPTITLRADGPIVVDVAATLDHAAAHGLLAKTVGRDEHHDLTKSNTSNQNQKGSQRDATQSTRPLHRDGPYTAV